MRILLADDHPLFAEALKILIERNFPASDLAVVGDLEAAHRTLAEPPGYDLAIVDLRMPGVAGLEGVERILANFPAVPLIVISGNASASEVAGALRRGARAFLPKTLPSEVLAAALRVVAAGGTYVPTEYAQVATGAVPSTAAAAAGLTPRESEVLACLAGGLSNKEIGRSLSLQEITVKLHVRNIFRKLGVRNRVEASNAALRMGIPPKQR